MDGRITKPNQSAEVARDAAAKGLEIASADLVLHAKMISRLEEWADAQR